MPKEPLIITEQTDERGNVMYHTNRPVEPDSQEDLNTLKKAGFPDEFVDAVQQHAEMHKREEAIKAKYARIARQARIAAVSIISVFLGVSAYFLYFGNAVLAGSILLGWAVSEIIVMEVLRVLRRGKNATD